MTTVLYPTACVKANYSSCIQLLIRLHWYTSIPFAVSFHVTERTSAMSFHLKWNTFKCSFLSDPQVPCAVCFPVRLCTTFSSRQALQDLMVELLDYTTLSCPVINSHLKCYYSCMPADAFVYIYKDAIPAKSTNSTFQCDLILQKGSHFLQTCFELLT